MLTLLPTPMRSSLRTPAALVLASLIALVATPSCVDSAITRFVSDVEPIDADAVPDIADDILVPDGSEVIDADCSEDSDCLSVLGELTACQVPVCNRDAGTCVAGIKPDCCETADDCGTSDSPCIELQCPVPGGQCEPVDTCPPCQVDSDCEAQAPDCSQGRCSEGTCVFETLPTCCLTSDECDDADPCTNNICGDGGICIYLDAPTNGCCITPPVIETTFTPPPALQLIGNSATHDWQVIRTAFTPSPPEALYMGNPETFTVSVGGSDDIRENVVFELGNVAAGTDVEVKFQMYIDLREDPAVDEVRVFLTNGSNETRFVYTKDEAPIREWHAVKRTVTMTTGGPNVQLIINYRSNDTPDADVGFGVLVDDLTVRKDCGGDVECVNDSQCQVDSPCFEGFCDPNGECSVVPLADCCEDNSDCADDTCLQGVCDDNQCRQIPIDGCCADDSDCPTLDSCQGRFTCDSGQCIFDPSEITCDDNNVCTSDTCQNGGCVFTPIAGCGGDCVEDIAEFSFEGSDEGWTFDDPVDDFGWRRVTIDIPGQPQALYFGNPFDGPTGDPGFPLESAATSAPLTISPLASSVEIDFQLFLGFNNFLPTDDFRLEAQTTTGLTLTLWTLPPNTAANQPVNITVDASALIGATFQLRFVYASLDNIAVDGFGLLIDDVEISAACDGGVCQTAADCGPGTACSSPFCQGGACGFAPTPCDDDDPCTQDVCDNAAGGCLFIPIPGCGGCQSAAECDDGQPCTEDICGASGNCQNIPIAGCGGCASDAACDDGNICTINRCDLPTGLCEADVVPNCCASDIDCADNNACTDDVCLPGIGICANLVEPGCCTTGADCNDGDPCTADLCGGNGECANPFDPSIAGCEPECQFNFQCQDGDPCTDDSCTQGVCENVEDPNNPGCGVDCQFNFQCQDGDPCTDDACQGGTCVNTPDPNNPGCNGNCQFNFQCQDGDPCTDNICDNGQCLNPFDPNNPGCNGNCQFNFQCQDGDPCTDDSCDGGQCENVFDPNNPGCNIECQGDDECDDGDNCTNDICTPDGECVSFPEPGLPGCATCQGDDDCVDMDVCTADSCFNGQCVNIPDPSLPGCGGGCTTAADCADGASCTEDICIADGTCFNPPIPGCCTVDSDCQTTNVCEVGFCGAGGVCGTQPSTAPECTCEGGCNDNNACTQDICAPGQGCLNQPIEGCCNNDAMCSDNDPCTFENCFENVCVFTPIPIPGCNGPPCNTDAECQDGNPCTTNFCGLNGTCAENLIPGCCGSDSDCSDDDLCTIDTCLEDQGVCFNTPDPCNDLDPCTIDACDPDVGCTNTPDPTCCTADADCPTPVECEVGSCVQGQCFFTPDPDCCASDLDCVDPLCGLGECNNGECSFGNCCEVGPSGVPCDDGNACTQDICGASGNCNNTPIAGCCTQDSECGPPGDCETVSCDTATNACVTAVDPDCCEPENFFWFTFEANSLAAWTISTTPANSSSTWSITDNRSNEGTFSLYAGDPDLQTYEGDTEHVITSPAVALPQAIGVSLTFDIFLDNEINFDDVTIEVIQPGAPPVTVWDDSSVPGNQRQQWIEALANLTPWAGQTVQLRFSLVSDFIIENEGVYIDDLRFNTTCEAITSCNNNFECNDNDACTANSCVAGVCQAVEVPGCCKSDTECDDNYACSVDSCNNGTCVNALIAGCCVDSAECDDGRECTTDSCNTLANTCRFEEGPDCCDTSADCDDGIACSLDTCDATASCQNDPDFANPACCVDGVFFEDSFPINALPKWTIFDDGSNVGWQIHNGQVNSPPFALYYGDPVQGNYDSGARNFGTAVSDPFLIPFTAHAPVLDFSVWIDLGNFFLDDVLAVRVRVGGNTLTVWERLTDFNSNQQQQWVDFSLLLPEAVIGETVQLEIAFDSVDALGNQGEGAYFDNIRVSSECAP